MSRPLSVEKLRDRVIEAKDLNKHTQWDIAAATGLSNITVYNFLRGKCNNPHANTRKALYDYAWQTVNELKDKRSFSWFRRLFA